MTQWLKDRDFVNTVMFPAPTPSYTEETFKSKIRENCHQTTGPTSYNTKNA